MKGLIVNIEPSDFSVISFLWLSFFSSLLLQQGNTSPLGICRIKQGFWQNPSQNPSVDRPESSGTIYGSLNHQKRATVLQSREMVHSVDLLWNRLDQMGAVIQPRTRLTRSFEMGLLLQPFYYTPYSTFISEGNRIYGRPLQAIRPTCKQSPKCFGLVMK